MAESLSPTDGFRSTTITFGVLVGLVVILSLISSHAMRPWADPAGRIALALSFLGLGVGLGLVIRLQRSRRILSQLALEKERLAQAERFQVIMQQANDIIMLMRPDGQILEANDRAQQTYGYSLAQLERMNVKELRAPEAQTTVEVDLGKAAKGDLMRFEIFHQRRDGSRFPVDVSTRAVVFDGETFLLSFIRDITDRRRQEEALRQSEAQLTQSQKMESLGSLAGGVAHDLNNVLGAILSLASAHRNELQPTEPFAASLDTIINACLRGRGVVKSLLYFAHKDLKQVTAIDMNALVKELVQLLAHTTLQRVTLDMDLQEGLGTLQGDGGALSNTLMNLCVNALDAMPWGGSLTISTRRLPDGCLQVSVRDTGMGMTKEVQEKALEPFFTTKPLGKGTGLGLSMAYATLKAHDGTLEIRSVPDEGTDVLLTFPASRMSAAQPSPEAVQPASSKSTGPWRMLLVDDDELIRASVPPMLELLGHPVTTVSGGMEAVVLFERGLEVDLVILDMNMPGLDGATTLPLLLSLRPGQRVLMATGYSDRDITDLLKDHPSVFSIQKPFSLEEMQAKFTEIFG
jgi:PAS domain S-box-containing protein